MLYQFTSGGKLAMQFFTSEVQRPGRLNLVTPHWAHQWPDMVQVSRTLQNEHYTPARIGYDTVKRCYYFMMDDSWHSTLLTVTLTGLRIQPGYKSLHPRGPRTYWKVTDYGYWTGWRRSTGLYGERIEGELRPRFRVPGVVPRDPEEITVRAGGGIGGN